MSFNEWYTIMEETEGLPDAREFEYLACVLHIASQKELLRAGQRFMLENTGSLLPPFWTGRAHHMIVKYRPNNKDMEDFKAKFGRVFMLDVLAIGYDERCVAAVVKGMESTQPVPHITIAHSPEVSTVYSNELLADRSKWRRFLEISQMYTYFLAVKRDGSTWPSMPAQLASAAPLLK